MTRTRAGLLSTFVALTALGAATTGIRAASSAPSTGVGPSPASVAPTAIVQPSRTSVRKVLYVTHSAGFKHDVLPLSEQIFKELGTKSGWFEVTSTQDCSLLTADNLKQYDALVFYTTGELPISDQQKADLLAFVNDGKGFVGIHSATDTFYKWPAYGQMIGGYFDQHPWHELVTIKVEDRQHPSTKHLGASFQITDEIYQFKDWSRANLHVLLSLDAASVDLTKKGVHRTDKDFGVSWTREQGKGRVFYTSLGHRPEVWQDARYQQHLVEGLRWAIGK